MGRELRFTSGLNLLRADNSSGKSTALMAMLYALGLEGMLSPGGRVPLPHAMTDRVEVNGVASDVIESDVTLELSNGLGEVITITRAVKSAVRSRQLVTVAHGPAITGSASYRTTDYFVRRPGSAQNEAGFHHFLAKFLQLDLPRVGRMDGSEGLLYLETVFPYFFVEQKHGWSSIQARIPTYLGIRDVHKRSAEFVLGLDAFERIRKRQLIKSNMSALEVDWQAINKQAMELARLSDVVIRNPPGRIAKGLEDADFRPSVAVDTAWLTLEQAAEHFQGELASASEPVRTVGQEATEVEQRVQYLEARLRELLAVAAGIGEERGEYERQLLQIAQRLEALGEDLQRHKDSEVLSRLGSQHAHALIADHVCPTCHQELTDGADIAQHTMTIAENVDFIKRQIEAFEGSQSDVQRVLTAIRSREASLARDIRETRAEIRAARDALTSSNATPSIADIARRYTLAARANELSARAEEFASLRQALDDIWKQWNQQRELLNGIGGDALSERDRGKLQQLERAIRDQLVAYGFRSLNPNEIEVDEGSYRPTHEGFDLGFDLSASDMIRVIWSYLFGMLNVSRDNDGNHIGLLVFDEPRQQETARSSYRELLAHAVASAAVDKQIFATSEPLESLLQLLGEAKFNLIHLEPGEKLLRSDSIS
jgi:hypothetical protein